jgi:hypothetical protein
VAEKVALGQVFSEYFGFPRQSSFHKILHPHNQPGQVQIGDRRAEWTQLNYNPTNQIKNKYLHFQTASFDLLESIFIYGYTAQGWASAALQILNPVRPARRADKLAAICEPFV